MGIQFLKGNNNIIHNSSKQSIGGLSLLVEQHSLMIHMVVEGTEAGKNGDLLEQTSLRRELATWTILTAHISAMKASWEFLTIGSLSSVLGETLFR